MPDQLASMGGDGDRDGVVLSGVAVDDGAHRPLLADRLSQTGDAAHVGVTASRSMTEMKVGLFVPLGNGNANAEILRTLGREAEARGFESIWVAEHVVMFDDYESQYPYAADGRFPGGGDTGLLEPLTALTYLAAVTDRIRLGTGICLVPQRNPVYTAKQVVDLDNLSGGRVDFGIGVGWLKEEFDVVAAPFAQRGARTDEYLQVMRTPLDRRPVVVRGRALRRSASAACTRSRCSSRTRRSTSAARRNAALRRVARHGQGWYSFNRKPEDLDEPLARLDDAARRRGPVTGRHRADGLPVPPAARRRRRRGATGSRASTASSCSASPSRGHAQEPARHADHHGPRTVPPASPRRSWCPASTGSASTGTSTSSASWRSPPGDRGAHLDWSAPAGTLEWTCYDTAAHAVDTTFAPALFLASRRQHAYPAFEDVRPLAGATVDDLIDGLVAMSTILHAVDRHRAARRRWRSSAAGPQAQTAGVEDFAPGRAGADPAHVRHRVRAAGAVRARPRRVRSSGRAHARLVADRVRVRAHRRLRHDLVLRHGRPAGATPA